MRQLLECKLFHRRDYGKLKKKETICIFMVLLLLVLIVGCSYDEEVSEKSNIDESVYSVGFTADDRVSIADLKETYDLINYEILCYELEKTKICSTCGYVQCADDARNYWSNMIAKEMRQLKKSDEVETIDELEVRWGEFNQKSMEYAAKMYETNSFLCGSMYVPYAYKNFETKNELFYAAIVGISEKAGCMSPSQNYEKNENLNIQDFSYDWFSYEIYDDLNREISEIFDNDMSPTEINNKIMEVCSMLNDAEIAPIQSAYDNYETYLFDFKDYATTFIDYNNSLSKAEKQVVFDEGVLNDTYVSRQKIFLTEMLSLLYMIKAQNY